MGPSSDAGLYLCEFIFYASLCHAQRRAASATPGRHTVVQFVHCPPAGNPLSVDEITNMIKHIAVEILVQRAAKERM